MNRSSMPSKKQILKYWEKQFSSANEFFGWRVQYHDVFWNGDCMACGRWHKTQRAHLLAVSEGGSNEPSNLHVLCTTCHEESEMKTGQEYWDWFGFRLNSDSYLTIRLKAMIDTQPLSN